MDLHIHTVSTKRDKPFEFSIEKLKGYVIQEKVDLIAITNHNLFDAQQFSDITNALPIKVFPGIEVDIESGHLIVITDPSDIDDFTEKCAKVYRLNGAIITGIVFDMSLSRLSTPSLRNILSNEDSGSSRIKMLFFTPSDSS